MPRILLPPNLNVNTIRSIQHRAVASVVSGDKKLVFDFSVLGFADPLGTTMLASLVETLAARGCDVGFIEVDAKTKGTQYLRSAGFFEVLGYLPVDRSPQLDTTVEFTGIEGTDHLKYVQSKLKPWIKREVNLSRDTVDSLAVCISEMLQNIEHHGSGLGFSVAQHYPRANELRIAASDCGLGIPHHVRKVFPKMMDGPALVKACERGFSTKSNVRNRGFGLDNLIHYTVLNNGGSVQIRSGSATLRATKRGGKVNLEHRAESWSSVGTAVQISLRTDTLEHADPASQEAFEWYEFE